MQQKTSICLIWGSQSGPDREQPRAKPGQAGDLPCVALLCVAPLVVLVRRAYVEP